MRRHPILASMLSMLVPGLGQIYAMQTDRGLMIFIAFLIVGNLNVIWLSLFAATRSNFVTEDFWAILLPRGLHDLFAFYGVVFLVWQIIDAFCLTKAISNERKEP